MTEQKPLLNAHGQPRAFFGRKFGKGLSTAQKQLFDTLLPQLDFDLPTTGNLNPSDLIESKLQNLVVEVGYGGGEHLARKAIENPQTNYIGCEVFSSAIGKLLEKLEANKSSNVRLYTDDALKFLQAVPDASIDGVYLLYPDPWPKTRHHKRRFVSKLTLAELARTIKPGGFFCFATDIEDYANWTLAHIQRTEEFDWALVDPGSWHQPYAGWQPTRYETKARQQGRMHSFYFTFTRR